MRMRNSLAGLLLAASLLPATTAAYDTLERGEGGITALDILQMFAGHEGGANADFVDQLFGAGVMSNMNIPAEHLRVAFYDADSGRRMSRHEIRELVGDAPHDGMVELIFIAEDIAPGGLPMEVGQLVALMDASYVASMRRPPPIDVEFYDVRCGPQARLGGGVSGHTPREPCTPGQAEGPAEQQARTPDPAAAPPEAAAQDSPWQEIEIAHATRYPMSRLPRSEAAFQQRLQAHEFPPPAEAGLKALPVYFSGRSDDELFGQMEAWISDHIERGYELLDITDPIKELYGDEVLVAFLHVHVRKPQESAD